MVCFHDDSVDQQINMSKSSNSSYPCSRLKPNKKQRSTQLLNHLDIPAGCHQSRSAIIDIFILIAVTFACAFLLFPYFKILTCTLFQIIPIIVFSIKHEISQTPLIYGYLGLCFLFIAAAAVLAITLCSNKRCGKPGCKGMKKAAEFDIQLETEECLKNSSGLSSNVGVKKGLFELPRDHHKELEAELKKMAPINGRAVLVFRARCGCSIGRMEVPGFRKTRKVKK